MCNSPVKILNPKLAWSPSDPKYLVVQCNRCFECRARKQQEWFVRQYYEFINNKKGSNYFFTLTFDNDHLPVYEDKRDFQYIYKHGMRVKVKKPVDVRFQCFSGDYITKFLKLFRQNIHRKFPEKDVSGIKYFIAPEYGENTHRSHYHGNFFIPFFVPVHVFKEILCKSWHHGFVGASRKGGFLIKSISALEYTAKYSTKDLYFFDKVLDGYLDKASISEAEYNYRYERVKDYLPNLRVSNGFGASLASALKKDDKMFDKLLSDRPLFVPSKNGKLRSFAIPRYVIEKLTKHVDKYFTKCLGRPYFVLTDIGLQYKRLLLSDKIDTDIRDIRQLCSPQKLNLMKSKTSLDKKFLENISISFSEMIQRLDVWKISFYKNVLRYFPQEYLGKHSSDWYFRRSNFIVEKFFEQSFPQELFTMIHHNNGADLKKYGILLDVPLGRPLEGIKDSYHTLSKLGEFQNYERFCNILDEYNKYVCSYRSKERKLKRDRVDTVCNALADFVLYDSDGLIRPAV